MYTGREIAIFTDIHSLLEPTQAVLDDIKKRNITEIYSLGDNVGVGPNPKEVLDLLERYNVISIAGNSEEYLMLGIEPFISYFYGKKIESYLWTKDKLTERQLSNLFLYPHSIDLVLGGKKLALCHFINDVRCDYSMHSTWSYQRTRDPSQFLYTNSELQRKSIENGIMLNSEESARGFLSSKNDPLFSGKMVNLYDEIIQGHVHFKMLSEDDYTKFRTIRALGMAYGHDNIDSASYIILKEKDIGYDVEEILVPFDRDKMEDRIIKSSIPNKEEIIKFTSMKR